MLTEKQLSSFNQDGYLIVKHVLDDKDLIPLEREYDELLKHFADKMFAEGRIDSAFSGFGFDERFSRVVAQYPDAIDFFNISLPLVNGEIDPERYHAHKRMSGVHTWQPSRGPP